MKTFPKWTAIGLGALIVLTMLAGVALYPSGMEKLTRSYPNIPVGTVKISADPDAVARGKHIAVVWACTKCHGDNLSGMLLADDPFLGTLPASNLTSGKGGIGKSYTDADWVRAIRHGVKPNSRAEIFMYDFYATMSDRDLGDLVAFLKQIPPVDAEYPTLRYGAIFPAAPALGLFAPAAERIDHAALRPANPAPNATKEYGKYLAPLCDECHRSNLASKMGKWKQEDFVRAVRTGVLPDGKKISPAMSLKIYGEMNEVELAALWLYLMDGKP